MSKKTFIIQTNQWYVDSISLKKNQSLPFIRIISYEIT